MVILPALRFSVYGQVDFLNKLDTLYKHLDYYATLSPYAEDENVYNKIESTQGKIIDCLGAVLLDSTIHQFKIDSLLTHDELYFSHSPDGHLFLITIDEKTGGSYRSCFTYAYYQTGEGKWIFEEAIYGGNNDFGLYYGDIYQLDSINRLYFTLGGVITCNTCSYQRAELLKIDDNGLNRYIEFEFDGRSAGLVRFEYNHKEQLFEYEYIEYDGGLLFADEKKPLEGYLARYGGKRKFLAAEGQFIQLENCEYLEKVKYE